MRASRSVDCRRESRISRLRDSVQRWPMFSPLRLTIASTPRGRAASSSPAAGSQRISSAPEGSRRTSVTTSWPLARRAGTSLVPMSPDAPLTTTFTPRSCQQACGGRLSKVVPCQPCLRPSRASGTECARRSHSRRARSSSGFRSEFSPTRPASARSRRSAMSATTFAGAAQFASVSVLDAGGTIAAAIARSDLPERALPRDQHDGRPDLPRRRLRRLAESQSIVDESWALSGRRGRFEWPILIGSGLVFYVLWVGSPRSARCSGACSTIRTRSGSTRRSQRSSSHSPFRTCASRELAARLRSRRSSRWR